jgi:hypothetical protein
MGLMNGVERKQEWYGRELTSRRISSETTAPTHDSRAEPPVPASRERVSADPLTCRRSPSTRHADRTAIAGSTRLARRAGIQTDSLHADPLNTSRETVRGWTKQAR